jgi:hypothetical protein
MTAEGDIPSIQCKTNLRELTSIRKVDGLTLIFNDFMFQRSHRVSVAPRPRRSFLRTYRSLWSVALTELSSVGRVI